MLRALRSAVAAVLLALTAAACATRPTLPPPENHEVSVPSTAGIYKIGNPYQQDGIWYYPHEQPDYDETGGRFVVWPGIPWPTHRKWRNLRR